MRGEIDANSGRFSEAVARGDAAGVASVYGDEATLLPPGNEAVRGRKAIEGFWRGGMEVGLRSVELETLELGTDAELAYEVGRYRLVVERDDAGPRSELGNHVVVHKRQHDGSWKWAVEIFATQEPLA